MVFLTGFLFLLVGFRLSITHHCSVHNNSICDGDSATLHVPELSEGHRDCDLTLRDENDIIQEILTPSPIVNVPCNVSVIYLKLHCIHQKVEVLICYKLINDTNRHSTHKKGNDENHRRRHEFVIIPVGLFLLVLFLLCFYSC